MPVARTRDLRVPAARFAGVAPLPITFLDQRGAHLMHWREDDDGLTVRRAEPSPARRADGQIRVLIADDSRLVAEALMFALDSDPAIEAIGYALDGWEALE